MTKPIELPDDYYHTNFCALVDFVALRYQSLLSFDEQAFYRAFKAVSLSAQKLYIRLLTRKGDYFRAEKLNYPELEPYCECAAELAGAGLLAINPERSLELKMALLTKVELLQRSGKSELKTLKRAELEAALLAVEGPETDELAQQLGANDTVYQVLLGQHFNTYKLCFFGNLRQDMSDYVLRDLGLLLYEDYPLSQDQLLFQTRAQIERHLQYYVALDQLDEALDSDAAFMLAAVATLPEIDTNDITLTRRVERCLLAVARQLERIESLNEALELYQRCSRHPSRERQARILLKQGHVEPCLALCGAMIKAPVTEEEEVFARDFAFRTARKHLSKAELSAWSVPKRPGPRTETVLLVPRDCSVERLVAEHLAPEGECFYAENSLFNGVFGLYFWEVIFAPIKGAFFNPFQVAPADFSSANFTLSRAAMIQDRMETLSASTLAACVWQQWQAKQGRANPLVHWPELSEPLLTLALARIPIAHWRAVFARLLNDIPHHRSGFPDLIHFPDEGAYELVEVKAPGDKLQKNQGRWMHYFSQHKIPHRVLHVKYSDETRSDATV